MSAGTDHAVPPGLADLPLEVCRARDEAAYVETQAGITRAHLAVAAQKRALSHVALAGAMRAMLSVG